MDSCVVRIYTHTLAGIRMQAKTLNQTALNYIPTSWPCAKYLILVTFLNLPLIRTYMVSFPLNEPENEKDITAINYCSY